MMRRRALLVRNIAEGWKKKKKILQIFTKNDNTVKERLSLENVENVEFNIKFGSTDTSLQELARRRRNWVNLQ